MATARRKDAHQGASVGDQASGVDPDRPILLVGPPRALRGSITVANTGERRLALRGATVRRDGAPDLPGALSALVAAGSTGTVTLTVPVEPGTRPGEYAATVELAGIQHPAVLRVEAEPSVRLSPRRILASPGRQSITLVVTNDGNVDIPLAQLVRAPSRDGGPDRGPEIEFALGEEMLASAASTLTLTGTLEVPDTLEPTRRHHAAIPVGVADLEIIVLPRSTSEATS